VFMKCADFTRNSCAIKNYQNILKIKWLIHVCREPAKMPTSAKSCNASIPPFDIASPTTNCAQLMEPLAETKGFVPLDPHRWPSSQLRYTLTRADRILESCHFTPGFYVTIYLHKNCAVYYIYGSFSQYPSYRILQTCTTAFLRHA
jgi:hypothetical protein